MWCVIRLFLNACLLWGCSGHGTYVDNGNLVASVAGIVERVNKLVSVRPLQSRCVSLVYVSSYGVLWSRWCPCCLSRARYVGEIGDVVVGRVVEVGAKRWKVDINARQVCHGLCRLPSACVRMRVYSWFEYL